MRHEPKSLQAEKFVVDNLYYVDLVPMGPGISDTDPQSGEKGFGERYAGVSGVHYVQCAG
jgi:hypothetical protein